MQRTGRAAGAAAVDAVVLGAGVVLGWLSIPTVLLAVWLQTAVVLVTVPLALFQVAARAPQRPDVDAGVPPLRTGHRPTARGHLRVVAAFFAVHYGVFTVVIGSVVLTFVQLIGPDAAGTAVFRPGLAGLSLLGTLPPALLVVLTVRVVAANVPTAAADVRFLATDGSTLLADRATVVVRRAYLRIVPLHVGLVAVVGPLLHAPGRAAEVAIIGVVVSLTFVASLWRYPTTAELQATG